MGLQLGGICPLLQVFDMSASLAFYRDILGFELMRTAPARSRLAGDEFGWVWLRRDGTDLMLNSAYEPGVGRPPAADPARLAAHADTGLFIGCPDIDGAYEHLRAHGIAVDSPVVTSYGMKQLFLKDPDGFVLCFQWDAHQQVESPPD